jgi:hypothetical protein
VNEYTDAFMDGLTYSFMHNMSLGTYSTEIESDHVTTYALGELVGDITTSLIGTSMAVGGTVGGIALSPAGGVSVIAGYQSFGTTCKKI